MSKENFPTSGLDGYFQQREKQKRELLKVGQMEESKSYEINEDCVVQEYPSNKEVAVPAGWHLVVMKKYPEYVHINLFSKEGASVHVSLGNSQELPICKEEK